MATNVRNSDEKINLGELIQDDVELAGHTTVRTGGRAEHAAFPADFEQLRALLSHADSQGMPVTILGGGSNSLISDRGIAGLTILTDHLKRWHILGELFCVRCGMYLDRAIGLSIEAGLAGLEQLGGIPGTVGGAVKGNSGANGVQISDLLYFVDYMTFDGKLHRMQVCNADFSYRSSPFSHRDDIILYEAGFRLFPTSQTDDIRRTKEEVKERRKRSGQYENPNLGCIFKNPEHLQAGALIESCNLKGKTLGGAMVSTHHGNIIVNGSRNASATDIHDLAEFVHDAVAEKQGVDLEYEIHFIGRW